MLPISLCQIFIYFILYFVTLTRTNFFLEERFVIQWTFYNGNLTNIFCSSYRLRLCLCRFSCIVVLLTGVVMCKVSWPSEVADMFRMHKTSKMQLSQYLARTRGHIMEMYSFYLAITLRQMSAEICKFWQITTVLLKSLKGELMLTALTLKNQIVLTFCLFYHFPKRFLITKANWNENYLIYRLKHIKVKIWNIKTNMLRVLHA